MAIADPPTITSTAAWRRADRVLWRHTLDGVVLLPLAGATGRRDAQPGDPEPVALRGSAVGIWELLVEPTTAADLVVMLAASSGLDEERVAVEVDGALEAMLELGALCRD